MFNSIENNMICLIHCSKGPVEVREFREYPVLRARQAPKVTQEQQDRMEMLDHKVMLRRHRTNSHRGKVPLLSLAFVCLNWFNVRQHDSGLKESSAMKVCGNQESLGCIAGTPLKNSSNANNLLISASLSVTVNFRFRTPHFYLIYSIFWKNCVEKEINKLCEYESENPQFISTL